MARSSGADRTTPDGGTSSTIKLVDLSCASYASIGFSVGLRVRQLSENYGRGGGVGVP